MLVDIHSHTYQKLNHTIYNYDVYENPILPNKILFSAGIHPWNVSISHLDWYLKVIERIARHDYCVAIGECGLDYKKNKNIKEQIYLFERQIDIAIHYDIPVILHCVGAFHDFLQINKNFQNHTPWILHGFRQNINLARQCLDSGIFISFGAYILSGKYDDLLEYIPMNRVFFESDTWSGDISELYKYYANLSKMNFIDLSEQINFNFISIFRKIEVL